MTWFGRFKQDLKSLDPEDKRRFGWGMAALAVLVVLAFVDSSLFPGVQEALERFPRIVDVVSGALAVAAGLTLILTNKAMRTRRINEAVTSVGLAGLVRPLLGVEYVLSGILRGRAAELVALRDQFEKENGKQSPLKWTRSLIVATGTAYGNDPGTPSQTEDVEGHKEVADTTRDGGNVPSDARQDLVDECIREIVGSVRNWTDTLVLTELGQQSLFSIQSLRSDLQLVEYLMKPPRSATKDDIDWMLTVLRDRVLFLATAFEAASMPRNVRPEVVGALQRWRASDKTKPEIPEAHQLTKPDVVAQYLRVMKEAGETLSEPAVNAKRRERRLEAEEEIEAFYLSQDHAKTASNASTPRQRTTANTEGGLAP